MRVVKVSTTAYSEEDFFLLTNLTDDQISEVIQPIVNAERDGYDDYDNDLLFNSLVVRFPDSFVQMIVEFDEFNL